MSYSTLYPGHYLKGGKTEYIAGQIVKECDYTFKNTGVQIPQSPTRDGRHVVYVPGTSLQPADNVLTLLHTFQSLENCHTIDEVTD